MIFAVVTLLDEEAREKIHGILLNSGESKLAIPDKEFTHLSWIVAGKMDISRVENELMRIAKVSIPIKIQSGGLGIFPGENPAIVLNFARTESLTKFHKTIFEKCTGILGEIKPYSNTEYWMPHVTLMHSNEQSDAKMNLLFQQLYKSISIEICLDNLAILYDDEKNSGMLKRCQFMLEC